MLARVRSLRAVLLAGLVPVRAVLLIFLTAVGPISFALGATPRLIALRVLILGALAAPEGLLAALSSTALLLGLPSIEIRVAYLLKSLLEDLGVNLRADCREEALDLTEVHLLHVLDVRQQLRLVGQHLRSHAA